jgi:hypothetical protein
VRDLKRRARVAGIWYLAMAITGPIGILYAPSQIEAAGDAAATAANLLAHPLLAKVGVLASIACQVFFVLLVLALERLFDGVNDRLSRLMHSLVLVAVPIAITNELLVLCALEVVKQPSPNRDALALAFIDAHRLGIDVVAGFFWGLWLFPFGLLAIRSTFIPKLLGRLLILGGCSYLLDGMLALFAPTLRSAVSDVILLPLAVGELSMVGWLLIKGVRERA